MSWLSELRNRIFVKPPAVRVWRIGISPGHGGKDPGAIAADGTTEAALARKISESLEARLRLNPLFDPVVYGMNEITKNYAQRVADSNANGDDFYIPVHLNASTNVHVNGWMVLVDPADVQKNPNVMGLAASVVKELQQVVQLGFADYDTKKDGVQPGEDRPIYELSKPIADTLYLECGFISCADWTKRMEEDVNLIPRIADAVATGMARFLALAGASFPKRKK